MTRSDAARDLLVHIDQLRAAVVAREADMIQLAIATGHTSLVRTVHGMVEAVEKARHKVERVTRTPKEQKK
jgi:hypothetical protein